MLVLGVETSCDETAAAIVGPHGIVSDVVHTQQVHQDYGGVVPELASRAHVRKLGAVVRAALDQASLERPDAVAVTAGPGLVGAVLVGLSYAKALAMGWQVPLIGVNHLEGHLLSPLLEQGEARFPFLGLVVSGGHTALYRCTGLGDYTLLGETVDDAAGEAFDKCARMLGLGYPGGPIVDRLAASGESTAIPFPRPLPGEMNWSFSGLKTAVRTYLQRDGTASDADVCASFQAAVVDCLVRRVEQAAAATGISSVAVAGGVAANSALRQRLADGPLTAWLPERSRCTDNGAMIAFAGRQHLLAGRTDGVELAARPHWPLGVPA